MRRRYWGLSRLAGDRFVQVYCRKRFLYLPYRLLPDPHRQTLVQGVDHLKQQLRPYLLKKRLFLVLQVVDIQDSEG